MSDSFDRWTRAQVSQYSVDLRQFIGFRQAVLPNGQRIVEAYNSSGLTFTLLPDRGLDVWQAFYNGLPLTWISQNAPHPPDVGQPWLRQFNGGLLVTCGLTHAGHPETDPETGEVRGLHGKYSRLRASDLSTRAGWESGPDGEQYVVSLRGTIAEAVLFGEQLRLERTYRLVLGEPTIEVQDTVTNVGDLPSPLMVLYHCNLGYPLVRAGTHLHTPGAAVYSRNTRAAEGYAQWADYAAPESGFEEQVYFHQVKAGTDGWAEVALLNEDVGLSFQWDTTSAPYLTQWKNTRQGIYVNGVEPGNCIPEGQQGARDSGRLVTLEPGAAQAFHLKLTGLAGDALTAARDRIDALKLDGSAAAGCNLDDFAQQQGA